jgi:hypothetical protein
MPDYGTRSDCTRDNVAVRLPCASTLGYGLPVSKRGNWVSFVILDHRHSSNRAFGRVVGRVVCEGKTYVEVMRFFPDTCGVGVCWPDTGGVRVWWVDPVTVKTCYPNPPYESLDFLLGPWTNPDAILRRGAQGFAFNYRCDKNGKPAPWSRRKLAVERKRVMGYRIVKGVA